MTLPWSRLFRTSDAVQPADEAQGRNRGDWLRAMRTYLTTIAGGNLVWEGLHLPLYTIWRTGTLGENAFAVLHCTLGDVLIALSTLMLALLLCGDRLWPAARFRRIAALTLGFGLAYTGFSEWLNVVVREAWAYSELMPVIPAPGGFQLGISPLLQWAVVPSLAFWRVRRTAEGRPAATSRAGANGPR